MKLTGSIVDASEFDLATLKDVQQVNKKTNLKTRSDISINTNNLREVSKPIKLILEDLKTSLASQTASRRNSSLKYGPERKKEKEEEKENGDSLRDIDQGYAWIILVVMFIINASTYGTARAYGLIFEKLARQDIQSREAAALPFTIMGAVENMGGPLTGYLLTRFKSWRATVFFGSLLITLAHLLAAYFTSQLGQILTIGLMAGIGLSFVSISSFQINNAYFVRYRSRAFGLGLTGAAFGTFYISPLCQYVLTYYSTSCCYITLSLILLPNIPLSLLLRSQASQYRRSSATSLTYANSEQKILSEGTGSNGTSTSDNTGATPNRTKIQTVSDATEPANQASSADYRRHGGRQQRIKSEQISTVSGKLSDSLMKSKECSIWHSVWLVLKNPLFHLIWLTQLMFCWLNFVYGMILVDFGRDKDLEEYQIAQLIPIWAFGQLFGRIGLGSLVDLNFMSYKHLTVTSFFVIGLASWLLNVFEDQDYNGTKISVLVFILSMFIANLYILFNGLVVVYMDESLTALTIGISSFIGSFFLIPRARVIGHYRDENGNYDAMLAMFTYISIAAAISWIILPLILEKFQRLKQSPISDLPHSLEQVR